MIIQLPLSNTNITKNRQFISRRTTPETKLYKFIFIILFFLFLIFSATHSNAFQFSDWDIVLKNHVKLGLLDGVRLNTVDYRKIKLDPIFHRLENNLSSFPISKLRTNKEKLSFWINVYNIFAVKIVTDNYPLKSINDVGGFFKSVWKIRAGTVDNKKYTLDEIEHQILRKMGDPRIHTAIVCASISCPDLAMEAYKPEKLDDQLDKQMRIFLSNPSKGMKVDAKIMPPKVYLSPIFDWFEEDFKSNGGIINFINPYVLQKYKDALKNPDLSISYMHYNWSINGS
jgi:hypothetical protein